MNNTVLHIPLISLFCKNQRIIGVYNVLTIHGIGYTQVFIKAFFTTSFFLS